MVGLQQQYSTVWQSNFLPCPALQLTWFFASRSAAWPRSKISRPAAASSNASTTTFHANIHPITARQTSVTARQTGVPTDREMAWHLHQATDPASACPGQLPDADALLSYHTTTGTVVQTTVLYEQRIAAQRSSVESMRNSETGM